MITPYGFPYENSLAGFLTATKLPHIHDSDARIAFVGDVLFGGSIDRSESLGRERKCHPYVSDLALGMA
jgi:hypothetical protein